MSWIPTHEQMIQTQLSRNDLVQLIGQPDIAQQVIPGFFIRVLIELPNGTEAYRSYSIRRLAAGRQYNGFSNDRAAVTTWYLELHTPQVLEHLAARPDAADAAGVNGTAFQLNCISNSPITDMEYNLWVQEVPSDPVRRQGIQGFHERRARMVQQMPNLSTGPTRRGGGGGGGAAAPLAGPPAPVSMVSNGPNRPPAAAAVSAPQMPPAQPSSSSSSGAAVGGNAAAAAPVRSPITAQSLGATVNGGGGGLGATVRSGSSGAADNSNELGSPDSLRPSGTMSINPRNGAVGGLASKAIEAAAAASVNVNGGAAVAVAATTNGGLRGSGSTVGQDGAALSEQQREQLLAALKRNTIEELREKNFLCLDPRFFATTKLAILRTLENDLSDYLDKVREVVQNKKPACVACLSKPPSVVFLPCRHMALCRSCAVDLVSAKCPLCRETIVELWEPEEC